MQHVGSKAPIVALYNLMAKIAICPANASLRSVTYQVPESSERDNSRLAVEIDASGGETEVIQPWGPCTNLRANCLLEYTPKTIPCHRRANVSFG